MKTWGYKNLDAFKNDKDVYEFLNTGKRSFEKMLNAGIKLFRFLPKDGNEYDNCVCITLPDRTMETFGMGLQVMFDRIGILADVDIIRDVIKIKGVSKPGSNSS